MTDCTGKEMVFKILYWTEEILSRFGSGPLRGPYHLDEVTENHTVIAKKMKFLWPTEFIALLWPGAHHRHQPCLVD